MLLGRKNQYWENDDSTKWNLQISCNPYQITNDILHRTRTKKFHNSYGSTKDPKYSYINCYSQEEKQEKFKKP